MPIKMIALYRKPEDEAAFLQHYDEVHLPLVQQTPHLQSAIVSRGIETPMGPPPFFLVAEMTFPDRARFDEAMKSPENRAAGKDLMSFARDIVTLVVTEAR